MSEAKFKTMRHIETVRNYLNMIIHKLITPCHYTKDDKIDLFYLIHDLMDLSEYGLDYDPPIYSNESKRLRDLTLDRYFLITDFYAQPNYPNSEIVTIVKELLKRGEKHDQTKLEEPESSIFEIYTPKLKNCTYMSDEYKENLKEMKVALNHHYKHNRHHPEHFDSIDQMDIFDWLEMLADWKASTLRHNDGDIFRSIEENQKRFNYSNEMKEILINTVNLFDEVKHKANES